MNSSSLKRRSVAGFTLIELLIVVAIIAILAAIAVPNFLEAQTRAKVARVRADIRSVATGLESYRVDNNQYPPTPFVTGGDSGVMRVIPNLLSTPVSYLSSADFQDPFVASNLGAFQMFTRAGAIVSYSADPAYPFDPGGGPSDGKRYYYQSNFDPRRTSFLPDSASAIAAREAEGMWVTASYGPDRRRNLGSFGALDFLIPYDATNGTVSAGDVVRSQLDSAGGVR